jgi:hypothetical protein
MKIVITVTLATLTVLLILILLPILKDNILSENQRQAWEIKAHYANAMASPTVQILNLILFVVITIYLHNLSSKSEEKNLILQKQALDLNRQIAILQVRNDAYVAIRNDLDPIIRRMENLPMDMGERMHIIQDANRKIDDTILRYSIFFNNIYDETSIQELQKSINDLIAHPSPGLRRNILLQYDEILKQMSQMIMDTAFDETYKKQVAEEYILERGITFNESK